MILSGMFMVMLGSASVENRSLQPSLGQKSITLRRGTKGVICLCRLQQRVINWQGSKHCTRMSIKSLYQSLEPQLQDSTLLILTLISKMFLNVDSSRIKHTSNAFIKVRTNSFSILIAGEKQHRMTEDYTVGNYRGKQYFNFS